MDREVARENLSLLKSVFDRHNITFWLSWGTCLGAIREQNFIAHDYDTDIDVDLKDKERIKAVIPDLKAKGFEVVGEKKYVLKVARNGERIDISFCYKVTNPETKKSGWMDCDTFVEGDFFDGLETIEFLGETYKVPQNKIGYLTYIYGPSWHQEVKEDFWGDRYFWENKTFDRPKKPVDLAVRQENLNLIKALLEKNGIRFWLAEKTCLDAVLNNSDLQDDAGLNLNIYIQDKSKIIALVPELMEQGFENIKISQAVKLFTLVRRNELIEIHFVSAPNFSQRLKGYRWLCEKIDRKIIFCCWDFFGRFETIEFLGEKYYVPAQPRQYLNYLYGPIWQEQGFDQVSQEQRIDLLSKVLHQEQQVELPVREPWLFNKQQYDQLILHGDIITLKALNGTIDKGMMVLVRSHDQLSIQRVVEVKPDGKIRLTQDRKGEVDTWCTASSLIGQVTQLHSRLGFRFALNSRFSGILAILSSIKGAIR